MTVEPQTDYSNLKIQDNHELGLKEIDIENLPSGILFPEELNQYLKGQIQFLNHANGMLTKTLNEKENIIKLHETTIEELSSKKSKWEIKNELFPNVASAKFVELSKKLRDKTSEVESYKTKCSKLSQKLMNYENSLSISVENEIQADNTTNESIVSEFEQELKTVQEKLSQTTNKLFEVKNTNLQLKNDLKSAYKFLQQEIGDAFTTIQNLANLPSNWRGRAQQILNLQQKNSELQEKISVISEKGSDINTSANKPDLRKQAIEQLQKELSNAKTEIDDIKKKLNGSRARNKVLESDNFATKCKVNSMNEKNTQDEKMIKHLSTQITSAEETQNAIRKDHKLNLQKTEDEIKNLKIELSKQKCIIENSKTTINDRDLKIKDLNSSLNDRKSLSPTHRRDTAKDNKIQVLAVEVKRLLELTNVLTIRLEEERGAISDIEVMYRKERQKAAKLELKVSRIEMENNMTKSQTYTKSSITNKSSNNSAIDVTKVKCDDILINNLELAQENISALKSRLDILQKEKDLDFQRFSAIITETSNIIKNSPPSTLY